MSYVRTFNNFDKIVIFTNGTIIPKPSLISASIDTRVRYQIYNYGNALSRNTSKVIDVLSENKINYVHDRVMKWQDCAKIEKKKRTVEQTKFVFANCCVNDNFTLLHGKVYGCPFSSHAEISYAFMYSFIEANYAWWIDILYSSLGSALT